MADQEFGPAPPVRDPRSDEAQPLPAGPDSALPRRIPGSDESLPNRAPVGGTLPVSSPLANGPLPSRASAAPAGLPTRSPVSEAGLPVRTTRTRRSGRHSSPHQLSLPSDAPALVIAVPGEATQENKDITAEIAALAGASCQGAEVRVGFLGGSGDRLEDTVHGLRSNGPAPAAVVVPLIAFPDPPTIRAISGTVAASGLRCLVSAALGPHPLLGEVAHTRLAEAGLARASRAGRISIVTAAEGMIVGAAGGAEAVQAAGVVAVLLASRLAIPVVPASITDARGLQEAATRLYEARVARVALAPCVIGPELPPGALAGISARTGVACAPPLGSHPAIGQLVAMRYGGALADPKLAGLVT